MNSCSVLLKEAFNHIVKYFRDVSDDTNYISCMKCKTDKAKSADRNCNIPDAFFQARQIYTILDAIYQLEDNFNISDITYTTSSSEFNERMSLRHKTSHLIFHFQSCSFFIKRHEL